MAHRLHGPALSLGCLGMGAGLLFFLAGAAPNVGPSHFGDQEEHLGAGGPNNTKAEGVEASSVLASADMHTTHVLRKLHRDGSHS